jgi:tRNA (uracil-5-)-methyltransferase TRM9
MIQPLVHSRTAPYSRFMIYVWAYEQSSGSKRRMGAAASGEQTRPAPIFTPEPTEPVVSDGGPPKSEGSARLQDVLVPWVLQAPKDAAEKAQRDAGPGGSKGEANAESVEESQPEVLHRYYHLFVEGELQDLVVAAGEEAGYHVLPLAKGDLGDVLDNKQMRETDKWMRIKGVGWEADNWWIEGKVGMGPISPS